MSLWAFRFILWYLCILLVQPQNRFYFLHPLHIADLAVMGGVGLHVLSAMQEGRPLIRFGPATITALLLMLFSLISLYTGAMQTSSYWNSNIDLIFKNALVLIMIEAMALTVERVWAVQATMLFATLWWVKGGLRIAAAGSTYAGDRIHGPAVSLIENPNGFAYLMTVMIPLYLYFYQKCPFKYLRWGFLGLAVASVYIVLQTGSRTGLIALILVGAFLLPKYGAQYKKAIIIGGVAIFILSSSIGAMNMERYRTIWTSIQGFLASDYEDKDPSQMDQDEQSAWERKMKNLHTWRLIKEYPVFGVGIAPNDSLVMEKYYYASGQVHNEILYAGKQMGFIGMGLYISFVLGTFIRGWIIQRRARFTWPALADMGWTFKMQAMVIMIGGFFSPIPWNPITLTLAGSVSALILNLREHEGL